jgi:DUF4097 and DUF4098 domain-containing protein YvlB
MSKKTLVLALVATAATCTAYAETTRTLRATLSADAIASFAVENLAGTMTVTGGDAAAVEAIATVHGADDELAGTVAFEQVRGRDGRPTLRVRYPVDDHRTFRYPESGRRTVHYSGGTTAEYDGRRVKVSSTSGVLLYADVEVRVPRHLADVVFHNLVGKLLADGIDGRVRLESVSADIGATHLTGQVFADTGSGDVRAEAIGGSFTCNTGSGDCVISGFDGDELACDTGSGDISVRGAAGRRLEADTGSGDVRVENADVEDFNGDTGSGDVEVQLGGTRARRITADTGSGDVTVRLPADASFELDADVGSGDIVSRFADAQPIIHNRTVVGYRRADGRIRIAVDTGSGDVTVAPR